SYLEKYDPPWSIDGLCHSHIDWQGRAIPHHNHLKTGGDATMKKPEPAKKRIGRFLAKQTRGGAKGWSHKDAPDQRQQNKVVHSMDAVLWAMELGLTANQPSLRDVEEMTENLGPLMRNLVPASISDSTLDTEAQRLDAEYLQKKLVQRVRGFHRSNSLDLQWKEDSGPWCTRGMAIWGLGMLRILAYNTAQMLRRCRLRKKRSDGTRAAPRSWRSLFKAIEKSFELDADALCTG
ncbi:unnamed protein product, partial [marine sediment metagenome]